MHFHSRWIDRLCKTKVFSISYCDTQCRRFAKWLHIGKCGEPTEHSLICSTLLMGASTEIHSSNCGRPNDARRNITMSDTSCRCVQHCQSEISPASVLEGQLSRELCRALENEFVAQKQAAKLTFVYIGCEKNLLLSSRTPQLYTIPLSRNHIPVSYDRPRAFEVVNARKPPFDTRFFSVLPNVN